MEQKARVLVAMSGGVDSSAAVWLLREWGYDCVGATMELYGTPRSALEDARAAAERMGIPHHVFHLARDFEEQVIRRFVEGYRRGETPNPCVDCNRYLKFGLLHEKARELGCGYLATGHYARILEDGAGGFRLAKAADLSRDQSYVLYPIPRALLARTLFPLGGFTKAQVREIAGQAGLANAGKRDSQDICFIPDGDYPAFLERYTGQALPEGDILDQTGKVVGRHKGAAGLTLGQRRGVGVSADRRIYVCAKCMADNTVTVGPEEALYSTGCAAADWNWLIDPPEQPLDALVKTRYRQREQPARIIRLGDRVRLEFCTPQRAVTTGQAAVAYDGEGAVLGGGTIAEVWK